MVRRLLSLAAVVLVLLVAAFPVVAATEETTADESATDTTVTGDEGTAEEGTTGEEQEETAPAGPVAPPAVTVPPETADDTPADWTYRYLIPTLLALAVIVVIATTVQYFLRVVRNRYKVVE